MPNPVITNSHQANYHYIDSSGVPQKAKVARSMTATFRAGKLDAGQDAPRCNDKPLNAATSRLNALYGAQSYVRGHLLNNWLGGKANNRNLFPFSSALNHNHSNYVEDFVKNDVTGYNRNLIYGMNTTLTGGNTYLYEVSIHPLQADYASENMNDSSGVFHNYTNVSLKCYMNGISKTVT